MNSNMAGRVWNNLHPGIKANQNRSTGHKMY